MSGEAVAGASSNESLPHGRGRSGWCQFVVAALALSAVLSHAGELPDPGMTPGAVNETIDERAYQQVCHDKGWTRLYRPPAAFTNRLKRLQMRKYGYADLDPRDYDEDHLIPLCLGGAPQDPHNLWPQPRVSAHGASEKDALEAKLCRLVCDGRVPLREAQQEISRNWIEAYDKYVASGNFGRRRR